MYIRNAQGQLVWVPPTQGFAPATQMLQRQTVQDCIRQQMQREEWMRFNAPPPQDNLYFHDQNSVYDASTSTNNGRNNMISASNSVSMSNRGNMMTQVHQMYNQMDPPIPRVINGQNNMISSSNSVSMSNRGNMTNQMHQIYNQMDPPIPRVIHSAPVVSGPLGGPLTSPRSVNAGSNGFTPYNRGGVHPMPYSNMKAIEEEEFISDPTAYTSCMDTLFGSSIENQRDKLRTNEAGFSACNPLNVSTSDEVEVDIDLQSPSARKQRSRNENGFLCTGIRGPGKKFDYSCGKVPNHFGPHNDSFSVVSDANEKEEVSSSKSSSKSVDSKLILDVSENNNPKNESENEENTQDRASPKFSYEKVASSATEPDEKEAMGSHSSDGVLSVCNESYDEQSYLVDTMSVMNFKKTQCTVNTMEDTDFPRVANAFTEGPIDFQKSHVVSKDDDHSQDNGRKPDSKTSRDGSVNGDHPNDEVDSFKTKNIGDLADSTNSTRANANSVPTLHEVGTAQSTEEARTEEGVVCEVCTEESLPGVCTEESIGEMDTERSIHPTSCTGAEAEIDYLADDVPSFDCAYPSFDEPAEPRKGSNTTFPLTRSSSGGENKQVNANSSPLKPCHMREETLKPIGALIAKNTKLVANSDSFSTAVQ